ncbi:oligosaccharide flippase family protein [Tetragenococcus koreensis]|uniref:oligosaccharide flippase family protein n=1 Tax=Tetragenococcus koreensis TaxID=290335 RepID=UPI001F287B16|nr:oligosaccharide flippase family protein [Tetragenococcus koreensis]MCF1619995.1 oligosaccharide flippase family protein [Tetragenococcus koreensis]MCF1657466.1 oligosaccharide flippase family protein [Tetragenococcus koreensis]
MKKIVSNILYQGVYQVLKILLPIVTVPIVSKALGPEGIGTFNFVTSIVNMFIMACGLGLATYGTREIALVQDDKEKLSKKFWELEWFNSITVFFVLLVYLSVVFFLNDRIFYFVSILSILGSLFDISWFYRGVEDFKKITLADGFIKTVSFILIVLFVQQKDDLIWYFIIQTSNVLLSQLILWMFIFKYISFVKVSFKTTFSHLRPAASYFIGKIAIRIYTDLNKTVLGIFSTSTMVGFFSNSLQVSTIFRTLIGTFDAVLLPRVTNLTSKNSNKMTQVLSYAIDFQLFFSIPAMFGIMATNRQIIDWFFGPEFEFIQHTTPWLSPLVIITPLGLLVLRLFLIPRNQIKSYNMSVIFGAIVSIVVNFLFTPIFHIWGTIAAILASESFVTIIRIIEVLRNSQYKFNYFLILKYFVSGFLMYWIVVKTTGDLSSSIVTTLIQGIIGVVVYFILTAIMNANPLLDILRKKDNIFDLLS